MEGKSNRMPDGILFLERMKKMREEHYSDLIFKATDVFSDTTFNEDGSMTTSFPCDRQYQGYAGRIHGGILSAFIDLAMTWCLFGHGVVAATVRLNIKYSCPVLIGIDAVIHVDTPVKENAFLYSIRAYISQVDKKVVTADARFWIE